MALSSDLFCMPVNFITVEFDDSLGCYLLDPGQDPCICLNSKLRPGSEVYNLVYNDLLEFHYSIPKDSPIRLFQLERYFEELEYYVRPEPELVVVGRAMRAWVFHPKEGALHVVF